jgi:acetyl-CoA C-acetyltransferase
MFSDPENRMAGPVASPLRVGDCCANADGSSCVIVASEKKAKSLSKKPVWILGVGAATTSVNLAGRDLFTGLTVAEQAAQQAYAMAGIGPDDIDVAEVHDCFTIAELMAYENLGFAKPGEGKERNLPGRPHSGECRRGPVVQGPPHRGHRRFPDSYHRIAA